MVIRGYRVSILPAFLLAGKWYPSVVLENEKPAQFVTNNVNPFTCLIQRDTFGLLYMLNAVVVMIGELDMLHDLVTMPIINKHALSLVA